MIRVRKSDERGRAAHGWLDSRFTFSFADYHDPSHMGFRALRVINEDVVAPATGFGMHPHRDMEILTWVLSGTLAHQDSMGHRQDLTPGEMQRMSAGTGVVHSEVNPSKQDPVHLLQIWILPDRTGHEPAYEQKRFPGEERRGRLRLVASPDGRDGSLSIHQDVSVHVANLGERGKASLDLRPGRHAWVQAAKGSLAVNGVVLAPGDGAAVSGEPRVELEGRTDSEALVFDLA